MASPSSLAERLRGVLIFLAIVWAVAASFVAFELLALGGFSTLRGSSLALSRAVQNSTVCDAPEGAVAPGSVVAAAWMLGVHAGAEARVSSSLSPGGVTGNNAEQQQLLLARARAIYERAHADTERAAQALQVPVPPMFSPQNAVNALVDYPPVVEGDGDVTARALATAYGRRTCEVYKLGSYWGFGALMRNAAMGIDHPFDVEVTYYFRRLNIPEALWQPMIASGASADSQLDSDALTDGVNRYLGGQ